jgi:GNAT superfamily N-acetyltransferase
MSRAGQTHSDARTPNDLSARQPDGCGSISGMMRSIRPLTKEDFDAILGDLTAYWGDRGGDDVMRFAHHPTLLYHFGDSAWVVDEAGAIAAYLFGFRSQRRPSAYVQLVAVRANSRRQGLARALYETFEHWARAQGCRELEGLTRPENEVSIEFHVAVGWAARLVEDYAGPGEHRIVLRLALDDR